MLPFVLLPFYRPFTEGRRYSEHTEDGPGWEACSVGVRGAASGARRGLRVEGGRGVERRVVGSSPRCCWRRRHGGQSAGLDPIKGDLGTETQTSRPLEVMLVHLCSDFYTIGRLFLVNIKRPRGL